MGAGDKNDEPPEGKDEVPTSQFEIIDIQDPDIESYMQLSQELDEISSCLDALEKKNDDLHEELFKLLQESRQIRSEIKEADSVSNT